MKNFPIVVIFLIALGWISVVKANICDAVKVAPLESVVNCQRDNLPPPIYEILLECLPDFTLVELTLRLCSGTANNLPSRNPCFDKHDAYIDAHKEEIMAGVRRAEECTDQLVEDAKESKRKRRSFSLWY